MPTIPARRVFGAGLLYSKISAREVGSFRAESHDEKVNGEAHGLETLLGEREQLLQARDKLIQNLMTELREKKTQLARQEIEVWQKIERREAWKHRLSKIGIRIKD